MTFQVAEILVAASMRYPDHEMWFLFDWSSCHDKMPPSSFNASKFLLDEGFQYTKAGEQKPFLVGDMQLECEYPNKPAGVVFHGAGFGMQRVKYEAGEKPFFKPDAAKEYAGLPKGVRQLVWERGLYTEGMTCDGGKDKTEALSMVYAIMSQPDVKHQKSLLQLAIEEQGHVCVMLPKFHCETNRIDQSGAHGNFVTTLSRRCSKHVLARCQGRTARRSCIAGFLERRAITCAGTTAVTTPRIARRSSSAPRSFDSSIGARRHRRRPRTS